MKKKPPKLQNIYQTHGALTFLLAFYPLLPKVVEFHTKTYLGLIKALTGSVDNLEKNIKIVFGTRGMKTYQEFLQKHKKTILPSQIFSLFFNETKPKEGLKLLSEMFFDRHHRTFRNADKFRAAVIFALPDILASYPDSQNEHLRSRLIALTCNQAIIDRAITSQLAFIDTATYLLNQTRAKKDLHKQKQLEAIYASIEAKIKAELAGKASAFTAPLINSTREPINILLSNKDEHNLQEVLLLLALSPAKEISDRAKAAIQIFESE